MSEGSAPPPDGLLALGDESELARVIREAIGVGDYDEVAVYLPQFERVDGKTITFRPEKSHEFFDRLRLAPVGILLDIGMGRWDESLLLFPHEWYDCIPEGYVVTDINGKREPFHRGVTDDDKRCGCLPYGFKIDDAQKQRTAKRSRNDARPDQHRPCRARDAVEAR